VQRWNVLALVFALALAGVRSASAHGPLAAQTITFRQGHDKDIVVVLTYGLLISHDRGATWQWMCERAVGYSNLGGGYVPHIAYTQSGAIFSTAFTGLTVNRDGCTFGPTPAGTAFVSLDTLGPDHALYYAASDSNIPDTNIYKSIDDGMTFEPFTPPGSTSDDWWQTLVIAPSDPDRVYLSGFRLVNMCDPTGNNCTMYKRWLLFASSDGGQTLTALPGHLQLSGDASVGLKTAYDSAIEFVGVDPTAPDILYARVTNENGTVVGDALYRIDVATDTTWTRILGKADSISFVARASGQLVAGTTALGTFASGDRGATWTQLVGAPSIGCLAEDPEGNVWACSRNEPVGVRRSSDLVTWAPAMRFSEIVGPVDCPAGTVQHDVCVLDPLEWCAVEQTFGVTSSTVDCSVHGPPPPPPPPPAHAGCCDASGGAGASVMLAGFVAVFSRLTRRRSS
jgi:hypothetical protein